jgi:DNA-binding transcriptional ArsR family regulator
VNAVFRAIADPGRRELLDQLHIANGQTLTQLCQRLSMSRQAVSKHLGILARADLVIPLWRGREKLHYFNPIPLRRISEQWLDKYELSSARALIDLQRGLDALEPKEQ